MWTAHTLSACVACGPAEANLAAQAAAWQALAQQAVAQQRHSDAGTLFFRSHAACLVLPCRYFMENLLTGWAPHPLPCVAQCQQHRSTHEKLIGAPFSGPRPFWLTCRHHPGGVGRSNCLPQPPGAQHHVQPQPVWPRARQVERHHGESWPDVRPMLPPWAASFH